MFQVYCVDVYTQDRFIKYSLKKNQGIEKEPELDDKDIMSDISLLLILRLTVA